jgi:hypothetical protein
VLRGRGSRMARALNLSSGRRWYAWPRRAFDGRVVLVLVLLLGSAACDPLRYNDDVAVGPADGNRVQVRLRLCGDETIRSVELGEYRSSKDDRPERIVWEERFEHGAAVERFIVGVVEVGDPLELKRTKSYLLVVVTPRREMSVGFDLAELEAGRLHTGNARNVDEDQFLAAAAAFC